MGTNFYYIKKSSREKKQKLLDKLDEYYNEFKTSLENQEYKISNLVFDHYIEMGDIIPKKIHIGKLSYGWQFLWENYLGNNLSEIKGLLSNPEILIVDEYNDEFTVESFIEEIQHSLYAGRRSNDIDHLSEDGLRIANYKDFR